MNAWQLGVFLVPVTVGLVGLEVSALVEAFGAPRKTALVRLFSGMYADMRLEVEIY